ncbi:MAG: hypothetical protein AB1306_01315 [Nitrospirota bacterium]
MIPAHTPSGVLPPFLPGLLPSDPSAMAPYPVSMLDVAKRFAINEERIKILKGVMDYRKELRTSGIHNGFQWIDGSFVENIEVTLGRPPYDIDIITFAYRPDNFRDGDDWRKFIYSRLDLFDPAESKKKYYCDAYFVDMTSRSEFLVNQTAYWFGLFSHQRDTFLWKGMLQVPLDDDTEVIDFLNSGGSHAT